VNVARTQSCDQLSCAAQKDGLRLQAIFIEEPLFFSQPERRETSVHCRVADDELSRGSHAVRGKTLRREDGKS
jgi:hypothetical protein